MGHRDIVLYYAETTELLNENVFLKYCDRMEKERLSKIMRTGVRQNQVRSLSATYLLELGVQSLLTGKSARNINREEAQLLRFSYKENGKPYLTDYPEIHFSMSHSGDYAACAIGDSELGMDIQRHTGWKEGLAERFFTGKEIKLLEEKKAEGKEAYGELFFRLWSIKESYLKFTGKGMRQGLNTFEIDWKESAVTKKKIQYFPEKEHFPEIEEQFPEIEGYFQEINVIPGYACCLCAGHRIEEIRAEKISLIN